MIEAEIYGMMPKGKDTHAAQRAAGEHAQHAGNAGLCLVHELAQGVRVDPRNGNIRAKTIDDQKPDREEDALAKLGRLAEGAPAHVRRHLFCCRCHKAPLDQVKRRRTVPGSGGA